MEIGIDSFAAVGTTSDGKPANAHQSLAELLSAWPTPTVAALMYLALANITEKTFRFSTDDDTCCCCCTNKEHKTFQCRYGIEHRRSGAGLSKLCYVRPDFGRTCRDDCWPWFFIEAYPLFGYDLEDYDELFAEKLDLLLKIRDNEVVNWSGRHRPALKNQAIYPRPLQNPFPISLGVGGTPQSFVRAGVLGLPLMVAIIGGETHRFRPLVDLYREGRHQSRS